MKKLIAILCIAPFMHLFGRSISTAAVVSESSTTEIENLFVPSEAVGDTNKTDANNLNKVWIERTGA